MSKFVPAGFLIFVLVFVSRDFEIGTVCPLRRVDRQSRLVLIYFVYASFLVCLCHPTLSGCPFTTFVCLFICLSVHMGQTLLPQYLMNGLSNLDETYSEY